MKAGTAQSIELGKQIAGVKNAGGGLTAVLVSMARDRPANSILVRHSILAKHPKSKIYRHMLQLQE